MKFHGRRRGVRAEKTEPAYQIVDQATDGYCKECSGNAEGQPPRGRKGI